MKRSPNSIIDDYDDSKIRTVEMNCLTKESIVTIEDLSNELIYEIFEFLNSHHAFQAFYDLNKRFQNLFVHSNVPIKINISSVSKSLFQRYLKQIIQPHAYRIKSLRLSNPFVADMCLLLLPMMANLLRLETLIINNIESDRIQQLVGHLSVLPVLSSLTITSVGFIKNPYDIYYKIFRLRALKYYQMLFDILGYNMIAIDQLDCLLSYVPQLRSLHIAYLWPSRYIRTQGRSARLNYLTNISLKLDVRFDNVEHLVADYFRQVQVLRIVVNPNGSPDENTEYLNADRWERLISTYIPNLRIFDYQHTYHISWYDINREAYEALVDRFNSSFWVKRRWFFQHQYHPRSNIVAFFTINSYSKKDYMLHEQLVKNKWSTASGINEDPLHHVYIHSTNMMKQFMGHFSSANQVTFSRNFVVTGDSITTNLQLIVPMQQLTKLTVDCHSFSFEQLIELFQFTQNVHTLKLNSILPYQTDSVSIQQSEIFRLVSKTNTITNVTINEKITLEETQLLTALFPRMEYLTINLYKEALKPIARFLLSNFNYKTRYLSILCISCQYEDMTEELIILIESEKLLLDFAIKFIDKKLYLWW